MKRVGDGIQYRDIRATKDGNEQASAGGTDDVEHRFPPAVNGEDDLVGLVIPRGRCLPGCHASISGRAEFLGSIP
jgi:hypothetical protein